MTIPIIPGPFSFLKGATDAGLDAYYRAQARKDQLDQIKRMQDMQNVGLFTQLLPFMQPQAPSPVQVPGMSIPGMGMTPSVSFQGTPAYEVPGGVAESFKRLTGGVPRLGKSAEMRQQESQARVSEGTEQPKIRIAGAQATQEEAQASVQTAEAEKWLPILQGLNSQQIMQQKGIMSPEVAELADQVALEKMKTELAAQDPTRKELEVQSLIRDSLLKQLPKDKNMLRIAEYASIGGLGYLIAGLQQGGESHRMTIAANRDRINMMNQITLTARQLLTRAEAEYQDAFQAATNSIAIQTAPEKKQAKMIEDARAEFLRTYPKPDADAIFKQVQEQFGMTPEEFRQTSRTLSNLLGAPPEPTPKAAPTTKRKITQDQADYLKSIGKWDPALYEISK